MDVSTLNIGLPLLADWFVLVLVLIAINSRLHDTRREWLLALAVTVFALLIVTAIKEAMYAGLMGAAYLPLMGFFDYALSVASYVFFYLYTLAFIARRRAVRAALWYAAPAWGACMVALFASSYATGAFFAFDEGGMPQMTSLYWITQAGVYAIGVATLVLALVYRNVLRRTIVAVVFLYAALPLFFGAVVDAATGLNTVYLVSAIMLMVLFGFVDHEQHVRDLKAQACIAQQQNELAQARVQSAISQIQPHFIGNAISSIMVLCQRDPDEAVEALSDFSDYLRGNLDAVSAKEPIPFAEELAHVQAYMALEKRRYAEKLQVEYDIRARDFKVPALSVQVLMENAVKHGVGQKRAGGTVSLHAWKADDAYVVTVEDNGVGFDAMELDESHVGIRNARHRVEATCAGTLTIESTPGEGAVATIELPIRNTPKAVEPASPTIVLSQPMCASSPKASGPLRPNLAPAASATVESAKEATS